MIQDERLYEMYKEAFKRFQLSGKGSVAGKTIELKTKHKDGHEINVELSLSAVRIKDTWHALGIVRDISERKNMKNCFTGNPITDPLTTIYNRRFLCKCWNRRWNAPRRTGKSFSVIMPDLDHFKKINDRFGHAAGIRF